jgi:hypothetical protein
MNVYNVIVHKSYDYTMNMLYVLYTFAKSYDLLNCTNNS